MTNITVTIGATLPSIASRVRAYLEMIARQCKGCARKGSTCSHCMAEPAAGLVRDMNPQAVRFADPLEKTPEETIAEAKATIRAAREELKLRKRVRRAAGLEGYRHTKRADLTEDRLGILRQTSERPLARREIRVNSHGAMLSYLLKSMTDADLLTVEGHSHQRRYTITPQGTGFLAEQKTKTENQTEGSEP